MKKKLTAEEQVADLESKGVLFDLCSKQDAVKFLKYNNYYFKLKAYAKIYAMNPRTNQYINLEFAYLVELSKIDMYLRKLILEMALDIEHFLKTRLLCDLCNNEKEDGYNIVRKYIESDYTIVREICKKADSYSVCADLVEKHKEKKDFALWNIVEVMSFGRFVELYTLYYQEYDSYNYSSYLGSIKFLRNAAAHNNCLLSSLRIPNGTKKFRKTKQLTNALTKVKTLTSSARTKKMENPILHDFVALLFVYNDLLKMSATRKVRDIGMEKLRDFLCDENGRCLEHRDYFEKNDTIKENYRFIVNIVDYITNQNNNPKHVNFL